MPDTKTSALGALTGANVATGDKIPIDDVSAGSLLSITAQELMRVVQTDWAALGNIGGAVTITAPAMGLGRQYGTLNSATCTVTIASSSNQQASLQLVQDATGGRNPNWSGVTAWATADGGPPNLSVRAAAAIDAFYFESVNSVCTGYWLTEPIADLEEAVNTFTTTTYALVMGDSGKVIEANRVGAATISVPLNSEVAFPIGTRMDFAQIGAGATTITATTSAVTIRIRSALTGVIKGQYGVASIYKRATNEWVLGGDLT